MGVVKLVGKKVTTGASVTRRNFALGKVIAMGTNRTNMEGQNTVGQKVPRQKPLTMNVAIRLLRHLTIRNVVLGVTNTILELVCVIGTLVLVTGGELLLRLNTQQEHHPIQ